MKTVLVFALGWLITARIGLSVDAPGSKTVTPEGARCGFAATSSVIHNSYEVGEGATRTIVDMYCHDRQSNRCQVRYFNVPAAARKMSLAEFLQLGAPPSWSAPGTLEKAREVTLQGIKGEEYSVKGENYEGRVRIFVADGRVYIVSAIGSLTRKRGDSEQEGDSFLDSFQIVEK